MKSSKFDEMMDDIARLKIAYAAFVNAQIRHGYSKEECIEAMLHQVRRLRNDIGE